MTTRNLLVAIGSVFFGAFAVLALTVDPARSTGGLCARVSSPPKVVQDACHAIPELSSSGVTDAEATTLLRQWAAGWIDISSVKLLIEESYWEQDIDSLYRRFNANDRGVFCGGTAWTLMRLYNAFGLDSWIYNAGPEPGMTHVVTLVRAEGNIIVQDAYANYTLTDRGVTRSMCGACSRCSRDIARMNRLVRGKPTNKDFLLTTDESRGKERKDETGRGGTPRICRIVARSGRRQSLLGAGCRIWPVALLVGARRLERDDGAPPKWTDCRRSSYTC